MISQVIVDQVIATPMYRTKSSPLTLGVRGGDRGGKFGGEGGRGGGLGVNDVSSPFSGKGAEKYCHFASTTCRRRLQLADRVYL